MRKYLLLILLLLAIHLLLLINLRFTAWPEMFSYSYFRNNGFLIYKDMIHPYPPILTMALSYIYRIFGYQLIILKTVTWGIILINDILIFLIIKYLTKDIKYSVLGLLFYVLLQPFLEGNMLWFDLAIVPPILLSTYYCLRWIKKEGSSGWNLFCVGLLFALAALTKQTAGLFLLVFFIFGLFKKTKLRDLIMLLIGPLILVLPLLGRLLQEKALEDFVNWVVIYPFIYWSKFPGYIRLALEPKALTTLLLLFFPLILLFFKKGRTLFKNSLFNLMIALFICGLISVYPRFSFFHFQVALAFLTIIFAFLLKQYKKLGMYIAIFFFLIFFVIQKPVMSADWKGQSRFYAKEDLSLANTIAQDTQESDRIYLLGLNSSLYTMSGRLPPKRWFDNFGWYLEIPGVQEEILNRWKENVPQQIYWQEPLDGNWYDLGVYQPKKITDWIKANYNKEMKISDNIWLWERKLKK